MGGMYYQWAEFIKQARAKGYTGMFISTDGFDSSDAASIAGNALTAGAGTYYTTVSGPASAYPGTAMFLTDYKDKYGVSPVPFAAQGYDAMGICLKGIEAAAKANGNKLPDRISVAKAVRAMADYPGITGIFKFNSKGDLIVARYFIIHVISGNPALWNDNTIEKSLLVSPP